MPDVRIDTDDPLYVLRPCRGYSASLAVENIDRRIIGWMPVTVLGFETVRAWMDATNYVVQTQH